MAPRLTYKAAHEAENPLELSLRESFHFLEPQLRPPFPLTVPTHPEYLNLNRAILYGIFCEPKLAKVHIKHLHGIVVDGYGFFTTTLVMIVNDLYSKLTESVKVQLIWVTSEMIYVSARGVDCLLIALLRQILSGCFTEANLWLCSELVNLFLAKWDCLLEEEPSVLSSALYVYLRVLADHCRVSSDVKLESLKRREIMFCIKVLREQFHLCLKIGRDLIRLLQDLVHVPDFRAVWKDLLLNPNSLQTVGFSDISQLYRSRTSSRYFLLRITPEMEAHLRFLLTHVKFGSQMRYQVWFGRKFLRGLESQTLVIDIVRFICCGHHPPNSIIVSDVIQRWAVIGWLLRCCSKSYVEANVKLALFYDWLFFDERIDNIMNIEPAILLMVNSIPQYVDITQNLLEFLFLLVDFYDVERKNILVQGVSSSLGALVRKGVISSLDLLTSCDMISPYLSERLAKLGVSKEWQPLLPHISSALNLPLCLRLDPQKSLLDVPLTVSDNAVMSSGPLEVTNDIQMDSLEKLVQDLGETIRSSKSKGLQALDEILLSYINLDSQVFATDTVLCPEALSSKIAKEFERGGYKIFDENCDKDFQSATGMIIRYLIFSQHRGLHEMLLFWSKSGFQVGAFLLSYASRLAHDSSVENKLDEVSESGISLMKLHAEHHHRFMSVNKKESFKASGCQGEDQLVAKLLDGAFSAYRCFLMNSRNLLIGSDTSMAKLMFLDLMSCFKWEGNQLKLLLCSVFCHFPDFATCNEDLVKLLVYRLDDSDILDIHFGVALKKLTIFGENTEAIFQLIKSSLNWGIAEQHKFWSLLRAELAVSKVQIEKIVLESFYGGLDSNFMFIAISGLLALCSCLAPSSELVGAIMLLPNEKFPNFSSAVLATWAASNSSKLFDSLAKFLHKLNNGASSAKSLDTTLINSSACLWLPKFLDSLSKEDVNRLINLCEDLPDIRSILSCEKG